MDKKQKTMLVSILIILIIISLLIGYTFAKYYSIEEGRVASEIAKWSFKIDGWSSEEVNEISLINTADEVSLEDGKIAPGASGNFEIELDATDSEVDVKYNIEVVENGNKPDNLFFTVKKDGELCENSYSSLTELAENELNGVILQDEEQTVNFQIIWEWPYETGENETDIALQDVEDTSFGAGTVQGQENVFDYEISLKVVGTQAKVTT